MKNNGNGALFFDCGLGKTRVALEAYRALRENDLRLLVICPLNLIENAWIPDIKKFTEFSYQSLRESKIYNRDIFLINYSLLVRSVKKQLMVKRMLKHPFMVVLDESQFIKTHNAKITKTILNLKPKHKICLSGTPAPNDETEYWAQMKFVKPDIFPRFYSFRKEYFHLQNDRGQVANPAFMSKDVARELFKRGFKHTLSDENRKRMFDVMSPYCIWRKIDDCIDLPGRTVLVRKVSMKNDQRDIYKRMKDHLVVEIKQKKIAAPMALTKLIKLRQITGGFLISDESVYDIENSKIEELKEVLDEIGNHQVIIWGNFRHEIDKMHKTLPGAGRIDGTTDNKDETIKRFMAGEMQYLIANPQSIAHGITLTNCRYQVFYSMSYSYEQFYQAMARTYRIGQKSHCVYFVLACKDSIDEDIYEVVSNKQNKNEIARRLLNDSLS